MFPIQIQVSLLKQDRIRQMAALHLILEDSCIKFISTGISPHTGTHLRIRLSVTDKNAEMEIFAVQ